MYRVVTLLGPYYIIIIFLCVFLLTFFFLKKTFFTFYDPLLLYILFNSFSIAFVIYLYIFIKSISFFYFITFLISNIAFFFGVRVGSKKLFAGTLKLVERDNFIRYTDLFDIVLFLSICIILISNAILFAYKGIPLLSNNPSAAKVQLFSGGFGLVRRINLSVINAVLIIIFLKLFHPVLILGRRQKIILIIYLLLCLIIISSSGSKGALLGIMLPLCFVYVINRFYNNKYLAKKISMLALIMVIPSFIYALLVIYLSGRNKLLYNLYVRLVSSGDTFYYFYNYDLLKYFNFNIVDYVYRALSSLLAMFRIVKHEKAIGELIYSYVYGGGLRGFGPNAQHPIEGLIYFGKYFAWLYSFLIGYLISYSRTWVLYKMRNNPHFMNLFIYIIIALMITSLPVDSGIFFEILFDTIFFLSPIFFISYFIQKAVELKTRYHVQSTV